MDMDRDLQRISARILALCWADPQFKQRFRQDPVGIFQEQGYTPPAGETLTPETEPVRSILEEADRYAPPTDAAASPRLPAQGPMSSHSPASPMPWTNFGGYAYPAYSFYPAHIASQGYPSYPVYPQPYPRAYPQPYFAPAQVSYYPAGLYGQPLMCAHPIPFGYVHTAEAGSAYAAPSPAAYVVPPMCANPQFHPWHQGEPGSVPPMCGRPQLQPPAGQGEGSRIPPMCG
ncbi:nitrile hydratase subunit alpha [Paenibacillus sp. sptzw28]|uniref:nitrile hydratase subunit alpha n=1 Tax=Paenibacillus sp. sptzw28 TaxID=715179 RepID=UPI001C6E97AD|nr:nitrile hydratase subunit alpha [Paenibacillus sp. sptzw28]QYR20281.1 nitrile hydratase subunit alpha [Paenibacillus sp. sptzw28]